MILAGALTEPNPREVTLLTFLLESIAGDWLKLFCNFIADLHDFQSQRPDSQWLSHVYLEKFQMTTLNTSETTYSGEETVGV